jgi:hypothetical protein
VGLTPWKELGKGEKPGLNRIWAVSVFQTGVTAVLAAFTAFVDIRVIVG